MAHIDEDDVVRRLRSLGDQPIDPDVAHRHTSLLNVTPFEAKSRRRPLVTAALVAGALLGGTGLAAAVPGPLPTQAASVAREALAKVNLAQEDKEAKDAAKEAEKAARKAAKAAGANGVERYLTGCTAGTPPTAFVGNHGQYVKAHPDDPATPNVNERQVAAQSNCGKPLTAVENSAEAGAGKPDDAGKPEDAGKPADAGKPEDVGQPADAGKPEDTGRPESPGKSEETHPSSSNASEAGAANAGDAGTPTSTP